MNARVKNAPAVKDKPTAIAKVQTAITGIQKIAQGIVELRSRYSGLVFDVADPKQLQAAKEARAQIREPRFEVERVRIDAKRDLLAVGKGLDTLAAKITADIMELEEPIDAQIKAEEKRQADEKAARIKAEADRVQRARDFITAIERTPLAYVHATSQVLEEVYLATQQIETGDWLAEFESSAVNAKVDAVKRLRELLMAAIQREEQAAKVEAQRIENERIAAEQKAAQKGMDEKAALEREDERKRLAAQQKAIDDEKAALEAERKRVEENEAKNIAWAKQIEEAGEKQRLQSLAREAAPQPIPPASSRLRPSADGIIDALVDHFNQPRWTVLEWLQEIDWENQ